MTYDNSFCDAVAFKFSKLESFEINPREKYEKMQSNGIY